METISRDFMIDLRKLRVLREVDRRGTVSEAARALHLTPSAVSQQIAGLARELGVPLLEKRGRGVALTGQARVVLRHAAAVDQQLERARADLVAWSEGTIGEIRISSLSTGISGLVGPALKRLRAERPGLRLRVFEQEPHEGIVALDCGDVDLIVQADSTSSPARGDMRYHRVDLVSDALDVVLPEGHPIADPDGVDLADLAELVWVGGHPACSSVAMGACAAAGFTPDVQHQAREWDAVGALIAAGVGVALIPRMAHALLPAGVVCCPVLGSSPARVLSALVRSGAERDPGVAALLDVLTEIAAQSPGDPC